MTEGSSVPRGALFALLAAFALLWFCNLGYRHLVKPGHRRAAHSFTPKTRNEAAVAQYCSGGFSKYL